METRARVLAAVGALLLAACAGAREGYLHPGYRFELPAKPKLALAPVLPHDARRAPSVDEAFVYVFGDKAAPEALVKPAFVRTVMESDRRSAILFSSMSVYPFTEEERRKGASLAEKAGPEEFERLRRVLRGADLLLIPRSWGIAEKAGRTFGACTLRLYDLRTGQLVYEHSSSHSVGKTGERAVMQVSRVLTVLAYKHYEETVLSRTR